VIQPHGNIGWGELRFAPRYLIDAIWLQFAEAVCGNKNYRQCLVCGKPFELSPDVARTSRLFCSDSCKMQSYRQRKAKTANLWDQGLSVQEIAEAVGSDDAYVRKWVARHLVARGATQQEVGERLGMPVGQVAKLLAKTKGKNDGA
jgi:predicted nucleic acid-binding Zn ribbon protein